MEIILKENISGLGYKDDLVTVKPGYGRNYLIPQGKAILATSSALKMREETLRQRSHKEEKVREEAEALAKKIAGLNIELGAKVGENGKIFGSVNTIQLAEALKKEGVDVERKSIDISGDAIKEEGSYEATIKLHRDITATVKFVVKGE